MPGGHLNFKPKRQNETCQYVFDFISNLAVGETITAQSVNVAVYSGNDPNPAAMLSGGAAVQNGTQVTQLFAAGVVGVIYQAFATAMTSLGQRLQISAYLAVIPELV